MSSLDYELSPQGMPIVRINLFGFLSEPHRAAAVWAEQLQTGECPVFTPPGAPHGTPHEIATWLAAQQAERISKARHWWLDPPVGELAIQAGADMRMADSLKAAKPPSPYGLLLCPSGIGYSADGMTVIAASWSPVEDGYWVTWWADVREYIAWLDETGAAAEKVLRYVGNLHYITGGFVNVVEAGPDDVDPPGLTVTTEPHPQLPGPTGTFAGCAQATAGAWWLLTHKVVDLERIRPTAEDSERDRRHGLVPSTITRAFLPDTTDPARLWDYGAIGEP